MKSELIKIKDKFILYLYVNHKMNYRIKLNQRRFLIISSYNHTEYKKITKINLTPEEK